MLRFAMCTPQGMLQLHVHNASLAGAYHPWTVPGLPGMAVHACVPERMLRCFAADALQDEDLK